MAKVIIYSTQYCPWCDKAKQWLKENKVEYEERNPQTDPKYGQELWQKSKQSGVPVMDIEGKIIIGFNVKAMKEALKIQ